MAHVNSANKIVILLLTQKNIIKYVCVYGILFFAGQKYKYNPFTGTDVVKSG